MRAATCAASNGARELELSESSANAIESFRLYVKVSIPGHYVVHNVILVGL